MMLLWTCLVLVRFGWVLWPQVGYIHPDEFFQTVEVVAGDALAIDVHRTWEFSEESPIRSIVLPKLLFHPVFTLLNFISQNTSVPTLELTGYKTLVGPRLVMAILSLSIDIIVYKLCTLMKLDAYKGIVLLASSYVMLTYQCHTFTNSIETLLFTFLLFVIFRSIIHHQECSKRSQTVKPQELETTSNQSNNEVNTSLTSNKVVSSVRGSTVHTRRTEGVGEETSHSGIPMDPQSQAVGMKECGSVAKSGMPRHTGADYTRTKRRNRKKGKVKSNDNNSLLKNTSNELSHKTEGNIFESPSNEKEPNLSPIVQSMSQGISNDVSIKTCIFLAFINIIGIFNRPTFVLFSCLPIIYWLFYFIYPLWKDNKMVPFFDRVSILILTSVFTVLLFCEIDTRYFKGISFIFVIISSASSCFMITNSSEIFSCYRLVVSEFTAVTPWNFFLYNSNDENLAEHGIHPPYLHILVNMPLLFGPFVFYIVKSLALHIKSLFTTVSKTYQKSKSKSQKKARGNKLTMSLKSDRHDKKPNEIPLHLFVIIPVLLFSTFPHQEPRFLIPLLPLVILHAVSVSQSLFGRYFVATFITFNLLLSVVFGMLHQGGLVPCLMKLQTEYKTFESHNQPDTSLNFIFSHTYMPPHHLLNKRSHVNVIDSEGKQLYGVT